MTLRRFIRVLPLLLLPIGVIAGLIYFGTTPQTATPRMDTANMSTLCAEFNSGRYSETYSQAGVANTALLLPGETLTFTTSDDAALDLLIGFERDAAADGVGEMTYTVSADRPQGPLIWSAAVRVDWDIACDPAPAVEENSGLLALETATQTLAAGEASELTLRIGNPGDDALADVSVQCRVASGDLIFMDPVTTNGAFPAAATTPVTLQLGIRPSLAPDVMLTSSVMVDAFTPGTVQCMLYSGDTPLAMAVALLTVG